MIKQFYTDVCCSVGGSDLSFHAKSGVRQGCVMSALLFSIVIDRVLSRATEDRRRGIRWTLSTVLEDSDYADDIASRLFHSLGDMQKKTSRLNRFSRQVGLKINPQDKSIACQHLSTIVHPWVGQLDLEITQQFTYLGSTAWSGWGGGGAGIDIRQRIGKARGAFAKLRPMWRRRNFSRRTKIKIYQACVLSVLRLRIWMLENMLCMLQSFHTSCLRKLLHIFWPKEISNSELFKLTEQGDMSIVLTRRRWSWVGHVLSKKSTSISKVALRWTPEGKRKRGRPKSTWRTTAEADLQDLNLTWGQASRRAKDPQEWRRLVDVLCVTGRLKDWWWWW